MQFSSTCRRLKDFMLSRPGRGPVKHTEEGHEEYYFFERIHFLFGAM
jgi:hypothetical protein